MFLPTLTRSNEIDFASTNRPLVGIFPEIQSVMDEWRAYARAAGKVFNHRVRPPIRNMMDREFPGRLRIERAGIAMSSATNTMEYDAFYVYAWFLIMSAPIGGKRPGTLSRSVGYLRGSSRNAQCQRRPRKRPPKSSAKRGSSPMDEMNEKSRRKRWRRGGKQGPE